MCEEAVRSLRLKVQDKPVELLFGDHEEQCRIVGDKNRLLQVITNFKMCIRDSLCNAARAPPCRIRR